MINFNKDILSNKLQTFKIKCKKHLISYYMNEWNLIRLLQEGKLDTYVKIKTNFGLEKYLLCLPFEQRKLICRLRTSSHNLQIERGRYFGIPRDQRLCTKCSMNVIEDEKHTLFECLSFVTERENMINVIQRHCINFSHLNNENKLLWVLNCENIEVLSAVCELVRQAI